MSEYQKSQPDQFLLDGTRVVQPPLSDSFRKSQHLLEFTIASLFLHRPVSHVLFVTLTSAKPLYSVEKGHDQLNKFFNMLRKHGREYLWVLEPQESGRIHYHLLIPVDFDAHDGTDLDAWRDRDLPDEFRDNSMNAVLKAESDWWKATASRYGFGRIEVAPIHSNAEAICNYMTKQDWRTRHWPFVEKKSVRFWSCSKGLRAGRVNFAWNSTGGQICRARQKEWAHQQGCDTEEELPVKLGNNWGYQFHQHISWLRALDRLTEELDSVEGLAEGRFSGRTAKPAETTEAAGRDPQATGQAWPRAKPGPCGGATGPEHEAAVRFDRCSSVPPAILSPFYSGPQLYEAFCK